MTISLGRYHSLPVRRQTPVGAYLGTVEDEVVLPARQVPTGTKLGDELRVFVYADSDGMPIATTGTPAATLGEFACLAVVDVSDHGAFLDWGLEKDLFVPFKEQHRRMIVGQRYVVAVYLDERSNRLAGSSRLGRFFDYDLSGVEPDQPVDLVVYDFNDQGALVIIDDRYSGLCYRNETFEELGVGDRRSGFVRRVRPDNKLDVALRPRGREASVEAQAVILERLRTEGGFLALHDKSSPEEIVAVLAMSKKTFKKAVGGLYRARKVILTDDGVRLLADP